MNNGDHQSANHFAPQLRSLADHLLLQSGGSHLPCCKVQILSCDDHPIGVQRKVLFKSQSRLKNDEAGEYIWKGNSSQLPLKKICHIAHSKDFPSGLSSSLHVVESFDLGRNYFEENAAKDTVTHSIYHYIFTQKRLFCEQWELQIFDSTWNQSLSFRT